MENCPVLIKDKIVRDEKIQKGVLIKSYSDDQNEDIKIKHEI
jgi:hypothetical protein